MNAEPIISVRNLKKYFPIRSGTFGAVKETVYAVDGIDLDVAPGETLAIVGESGCGKSTLGRLMLRLEMPTEGTISLAGQLIEELPASRLRRLRKRIQAVFQDPFSSLNPRMRVRDIVAEPIVNFEGGQSISQLRGRLERLMQQVGLPPEALDRLPHEFSGGQRQRIGIARALAARPDVIICDEAVSALDVSVKAQIVNLLADLQEELDMAIVFISHDLAIVENIAQRVGVMYLGKLVELTDKRRIFAQPYHPYTQSLLSAVPVADPDAPHRRVLLEGDIPSPVAPPAGCRFHTRCPLAFERCRVEEPLLREVGAGHFAACHLETAPSLLPSLIRESNDRS